MGGKVIVGTSGYSYNDWVGPFYPPGTKQRDFLSFYADHFDMTELNFTYYRQPDPATLSRMAALTPKEFLFAVKAHRTLTHQVERSLVASEKETFMRGIEPLIGSGKLVSVLFQFPFSFHYTKENRLYLDSLCNDFSQYPLSVEFRSREWMRDSVYQELRGRDVTLVNVDLPRLENLPSLTSVTTSGVAYLRFHGRNKENWWSGDNVSRYDYMYSETELREVIPGIKEMVQRAGVVLLVFNNHSKGQAVANATRLRELLNNES